MRRNNVIRFRRGARRHPRWDLGTPPDHRSPSRLRRIRRRLSHADPTTYLKGVIGLGIVGLIVLPFGADALNTIAGPRPVSGGCRVVSVTDGDTVRMYCPGRGIERARLRGFDTPEKFSPRCASEWARAVKATWALRRMLWQADRVSLVRSGTDRYGRALVTMTLDGAPVARRMIEAGLARPYAGGARQGWCDA